MVRRRSLFSEIYARRKGRRRPQLPRSKLKSRKRRENGGAGRARAGLDAEKAERAASDGLREAAAGACAEAVRGRTAAAQRRSSGGGAAASDGADVMTHAAEDRSQASDR
jgi:hypothetical protein